MRDEEASTAEGESQARAKQSAVSRTASSTGPNSSNFWRRVPSSVCHARPLGWVSYDEWSRATQGVARCDWCDWWNVPDKKLRHDERRGV